VLKLWCGMLVGSKGLEILFEIITHPAKSGVDVEKPEKS
jgi:hypothetical protein